MAIDFYTKKKSTGIFRPLVVVFVLLNFCTAFWSGRAMAQTLTISTGTSSGSGWSISSGTLTVTANSTVNVSEIHTALSSGSLTIVGNTTSFAVTLSTAINSATAGSNLTIGSSTNTGALTLGAAVTVNGAFTAYGGNIFAQQNITSTQSGAAVLLQATGYISLTASRTIQTNNGDITFRANSNGTAVAVPNSTTGTITLNSGSSLLSTGGNITLGGNFSGTKGAGLYAASARTGGAPGILISSATITAAGGNINIYGSCTTSYDDGIRLQAIISTTGSGTIGIYGDAYGGVTSGPPDVFFGGITFITNASTIETDAGNINVEATLTNTQSNGTYALNFYRTTYTSGSGTQDRHIQLISRSGNIQVTGDPGSTAAGGMGSSSWGNIYAGSPLSGSWTASGNVTFSYSRFVGALSNGIITNTTGAVTYEPVAASFTAAQTFPQSANYILAQNASSLTIGKPGNTGNVTISTAQSVAGPVTIYGGTLAINENLSSTAGGAISLYGNALSFAANVTVSSTGSLLVAPSSASTTIGVAGATGTLQITATHLGTNFADGFSNITIGSDNQTGAIATNAFTLRDPVTFRTTGSLTLGGKLAIGTNNVTLGSAMTVLGMPGNYFQTNSTGVVRRSIGHAGSGLFPVGNSAYNPVTIANNTGSADDFSVRVSDAVLTAGGTGTAITDKVVNRTWHIGKTNPNGGSGVNMTFQWNASEEGTNMTDYKLSHFGTFWAPASGTSGAVSGTTTKTMTHTGYMGTFSPFGIGSTGSALPVSWVDFTAVRAGQAVELNWRTGSEQNTKDFVVQHSTGNGSWTNIGNVSAAGFSSSVRSYRFTHTQPVDGRNLYRLLQRDLDGRESLSKVVSVVMPSATSVQVYPVPSTNGSVFVKLPADQVLKVFNSTGVLVLEQQGKAGVQSLDLRSLPKGLYYLQAGKETVRVMLQ